MPTFKEHYADKSYILSDDARAIISLKDKGAGKSAYEGNNKRKLHVTTYLVDGGIITDDSSKCDYALYTDEDILYFIELKGSDYSKALEQITSTVRQLLISPNIKPALVHARIVLSKARTPELRVTSETQLKSLLKGLGKGTLQKETQKMIEKL